MSTMECFDYYKKATPVALRPLAVGDIRKQQEMIEACQNCVDVEGVDVDPRNYYKDHKMEEVYEQHR